MDEVEMKKMALQMILKQIADNRDSSCAGHGCSVCPNQCKYYLEEIQHNTANRQVFAR